MAEEELQTFTSIMDALVRISVSKRRSFFVIRYLFQPRVLILNDISFVLITHICHISRRSISGRTGCVYDEEM